MAAHSVFVFVQRVEVSLTVLHPLHWVSEGSVYGEIQILDKVKRI